MSIFGRTEAVRPVAYPVPGLYAQCGGLNPSFLVGPDVQPLLGPGYNEYIKKRVLGMDLTKTPGVPLSPNIIRC